MTKKRFSKAQVKEKVEELFKKAESAFRTNKDLANDYIRRARNLAMKVRLRLGPELKRKFCKYCHSYLIPGQNLRVRLQGRKVVYYCSECKHFWRMPYIAEQQAKKQEKLKSSQSGDKNRKL